MWPAPKKGRRASYYADGSLPRIDPGCLAAEHITSLERIHVDTDKDGIVWLSGTASTRKAADKAVSIARDTEHVKDLHSHITIKSSE
jgi:hypothetical protein